MRYNAALNEVTTEGMKETQAFSILASGKAFRSLIDSLYSRKIEAPIRELSTNAYDAHLAVGNKEPFDIHLPTVFDPVFRIRDYGCSMTHEMVMSRFTTLFDSTKDGTSFDATTEHVQASADEQVGMLGLGSKSPFAYTDSFMMTAHLNGVSRVYSIYIGQNGQPLCSLVHTQDTSAETVPDGIMVEFPVRNDDHDKFRKSAIRVFKGFPFIPNGLPEDVVAELQKKPDEVGPFWRIFNDSSYLPHGKFYAKQGCVLYPVDFGEFLISDDLKSLTKFDHTLIMDFPIGSIDFTNSREEISYTPTTKTALNKQWDAYIKATRRKVNKELSRCKTPFERLMFGRNHSAYTYSYFRKNVPAFVEIRKLEEVYRKELPYRRGYQSGAFYSIIDNKGQASYYRDDWNVPRNLPRSFCLIYIDEKPIYCNKRIASYLKEKGIDYAYRLNKISLETYRKLGQPPMVRLSSLPKWSQPKAVKGSGYERTYGSFERFKVFTGHSFQTIEEIDREKDLFVLINCKEVVVPDGCEKHLFITNDEALTEVLLKQGRRIVGINVRKPELDETGTAAPAWADYPMLWDYKLDVTSMLTRPIVRDIVNLRNHELFEDSIYSYALTELNRHDWKQTSPLTDLKRFQRRARSVGKQKAYVEAFREIIEAASDITYQDVVTRALEYGYEVLPDKPTTMDKFSYPLLSKEWERIVFLINCFGYHYDFHKFMKEISNA